MSEKRVLLSETGFPMCTRCGRILARSYSHLFCAACDERLPIEEVARDLGKELTERLFSSSANHR